MQHAIPVTDLKTSVGPQIEHMAEAIESCVHCGFCLPVCPTYQELGQEMDSPRGRILLMKSALEGTLSLADVTPYVDRCLGCLACVIACPSGVQYNELLSPFRAYLRREVKPDVAKRLQRKLANETLPYPPRFRAAAGLGKLARPLKGLVPTSLRGMLDLLPDTLPDSRPLPALVRAEGQRRARVALLAGCVQQVLSPQINWATLRVLAKNGVEVVIPPGQGCCGALHMHTGEFEQARRLARANIAIFPEDVDCILTNAAGCGSGMQEYGLLFAGCEEQKRAEQFAERVQDVSQFLAELGLIQPPVFSQPLRAAYHDACHLIYAQGVASAPRQLLQAVENLTLVELADGGMCCGSAGTYNIEQPEIAGRLGENKAHFIIDSKSEAVIAGNIGCLVQIENHLKANGKSLPVFHTIEILDLAYRLGNVHV